jgi:hypothetical protein
VGNSWNNNNALQGGLHLWIGEAKRGGSLRHDLNGTVYFLESFFGEQAVMADLFDLEQAAVGLKATLA